MCINEVYLKHIKQFLGTGLGNAKKACEAAESARFELNSIKSRCKKADPSDLIRLQDKLQRQQDAYTASVDDAISLMRLVTESPEVVRCVQAMIDAQAKYYKTCYTMVTSASE